MAPGNQRLNLSEADEQILEMFFITTITHSHTEITTSLKALELDYYWDLY